MTKITRKFIGDPDLFQSKFEDDKFVDAGSNMMFISQKHKTIRCYCEGDEIIKTCSSITDFNLEIKKESDFYQSESIRSERIKPVLKPKRFLYCTREIKADPYYKMKFRVYEIVSNQISMLGQFTKSRGDWTGELNEVFLYIEEKTKLKQGQYTVQFAGC